MSDPVVCPTCGIMVPAEHVKTPLRLEAVTRLVEAARALDRLYAPGETPFPGLRVALAAFPGGEGSKG